MQIRPLEFPARLRCDNATFLLTHVVVIYLLLDDLFHLATKRVTIHLTASERFILMHRLF